jgi:hypothetical protein
MDESDRLETPPSLDRGRRLRRTLVAAGAALGMTLAGLGIAAAQTGQGDPPGTTVPADGDRHPRPGRHRPGPALGAAAGAIGISEDELRTALRSGQSIAQVAQSKGVDVQKVIDAVVADARNRIAAKVEAGDLTQAQADERLARLQQRVSDLVNRPGGFGGCHGGHGGGQRFGPRPADGEAPS